MAPTRQPSDRQTRSSRTRERAASPYSNRPNGDGQVVPTKAGSGSSSSKPPAQPSHRFGLRGMLSNLIWGSPPKKDADPEDDGEQDAEDQQPVGDGVHVISDDDDDNEGSNDGDAQMDEDVQDDGRPSSSNRLSAREKGKGRADARQTNGFSRGSSVFKASQTMGDLRALAGRDDVEDEVTGTGSGTDDRDNTNSTLARFFAEKGSTSLTAEERKRVAELLLGGTSAEKTTASATRSTGYPRMPQTPGRAFTAGADVPTALTPSFSFTAPRFPPRASAANTSILSPAFKRSSTISSNLGGAANGLARSGYSGGLSGSQSLSGLSSLAAAASNHNPALLSAAANPRSAVGRRAASRPLYLGAGYSSQAVARRKRAQAQMSGIFDSLESFERKAQDAQPNGADSVGTPGKRRRVGEEAATSTSFTVGSPSASRGPGPEVPTLSTGAASAPSPAPPAKPVQPLLFSSAPHLKAKFGMATPVKPSPLRQAAAVSSPATPGTPGSQAGEAKQPTPPRTSSRTTDLMRGILGDTFKAEEPASAPAPQDPFVEEEAHRPAKATAPVRQSTRVPRESLVKQPTKLSTMETLERTMPPELRPTANGRQARPKPPPVPGSARKTRATAAAEAKEPSQEGQAHNQPQAKADRKEKEREREAERQSERELREERRSKSRAKESPASLQPQNHKAVSRERSASAQPAVSDSETRTAQSSKAPVSKDPSPAPAQPPAKKATFSFAPSASPAPSPAPLFSATPTFSFAKPATVSVPTPSPSPSPAPAAATTTASPPLFSFTAPAPAAKPSPRAASPAAQNVTAARSAALKVPAASLPSYKLYEPSTTFALPSQGSSIPKAIRDLVLATPVRDLKVYPLM